MRLPLLSLIGTLSVIVGCSHSGNPTASSDEVIGQPMPQAIVQGSNTLSVAGVWTFTYDPDTLEATLTPKTERTASETDDTYALSVDRFFRPVHLVFTQIRNGGTSIINVSFDVIHPFPAPFNPEEPATGFGNRADLGFSGILALLADVPTASGNTFFGDRVVNTELVTNPHGYFSPEALLPVELTSNTFPYRLVVHDELGGNRHQAYSSGDARGNFGADGWTRAELGASRDQWAGYNVLHQGQSSYVNFRVSRSYVQGHSPVSFDLALFAKYNDPRGGVTPDERRANRLPPASPDLSIFGYRMPHGTWDLPQVIVRPEGGGFVANDESSSLLRVSLEDFDLFSPETSQTDLSLDPNPRAVNVGASGFPEIDVCIPGVLGDAGAFESFTPASDVVDDDSAYPDGDVGADSGRPYDLVMFEHLISKPAGTGQTPGSYRGLVRVTDPEAGAATGFIALDPNLVPLPTGAPLPVTYQGIEVTLAPGATGGTGWAKMLGVDDSVVTIHALTVDASDNVYIGGRYDGAVDFGGGLRTPDPSGDCFIVSFTPGGAYRWDHVWGNYEEEYVAQLLLEGSSLVVLASMYGSVDPGNGPVGGGGKFDLLLLLMDPADADVLLASAEGGADNDWPRGVAFDSSGRIVLAGASNGPTEIFDTEFDTDVEWPWIARGPATLNSLDWHQVFSSTLLPFFADMAVDDSDAVYAVGAFYDNITIDGVAYEGIETEATWLVKLTPGGSAEWTKIYAETSGVEDGYTYVDGLAIAASPTQHVLLAGGTYGEVDFGGGPVDTATLDNGSAMLVRLNPDGDWQAEEYTGLANGAFEYFHDLEVMSTGDLLFTGWFDVAVDFGGGERPSQNPDGDTPFVLKTTSAGAYIWDATWSGGGFTSNVHLVESGPGGNIALTGGINAIFDANPGASEFELDPGTDNEDIVIHLPGSPGW